MTTLLWHALCPPSLSGRPDCGYNKWSIYCFVSPFDIKILHIPVLQISILSHFSTQMQAAFIFISRTAFPDRMPDAVAKTLGLVTAGARGFHTTLLTSHNNYLKVYVNVVLDLYTQSYFELHHIIFEMIPSTYSFRLTLIYMYLRPHSKLTRHNSLYTSPTNHHSQRSPTFTSCTVHFRSSTVLRRGMSGPSTPNAAPSWTNIVGDFVYY